MHAMHLTPSPRTTEVILKGPSQSKWTEQQPYTVCDLIMQHRPSLRQVAEEQQHVPAGTVNNNAAQHVSHNQELA